MRKVLLLDVDSDNAQRGKVIFVRLHAAADLRLKSARPLGPVISQLEHRRKCVVT
jgi:hypothetical protein